MHYKILVNTVKYSVTRSGFSYVLLYAFSLVLYLIACFSNVTLLVSLILSIIMLYTSILSDKLSIVQMINAYNIVGLKRKEVALSFCIFTYTRILVILIAYLIAYPNPTTISYFFILSNVLVTLIFHFSFRRG